MFYLDILCEKYCMQVGLLKYLIRLVKSFVEPVFLLVVFFLNFFLAPAISVFILPASWCCWYFH